MQLRKRICLPIPMFTHPIQPHISSLTAISRKSKKHFLYSVYDASIEYLDERKYFTLPGSLFQ